MLEAPVAAQKVDKAPPVVIEAGAPRVETLRKLAALEAAKKVVEASLAVVGASPPRMKISEKRRPLWPPKRQLEHPQWQWTLRQPLDEMTRSWRPL
jgi:hypothetical protein